MLFDLLLNDEVFYVRRYIHYLRAQNTFVMASIFA